jgi:UTP-glucose-1-phosphate uridylyltransferase
MYTSNNEEYTFHEDRYLCYFGMDILTPGIFHFLEQRSKVLQPGKELNLRDPMGDLMKSEGMYGILMTGERLDTGLPREYAESVFKFARL